MKWKIKNVKVSDIKENPKNPRKLTEKGLKDLETSIKKFGNAEPPVLNKDLTLIGGHGRKKILERLNIKEVECYVSDKQLTPKQADELGIRLNKNIAGIFDFDILGNEYEVDELLEWGFEDWELLGAEDRQVKITTEEIRPYNKTHIMISFDPIHINKLSEIIKQIEKLEGVEVEQSSN